MNWLSNLFIKKKKYDHIISLGNNCEFSFQFFTNYKFVEAHLFSWTYIMNNERLLSCLQNIDGLLSDGLADPAPLYECNRYQIRFHGRAKWEDMVDIDGKFDMDVVNADKIEIFERVTHLKDKFNKMLEDKGSKLFVIKDPKEVDFVIRLKTVLDKIVKGKYDLLVVVTKNEYNLFKRVETHNIFVRTINNYTPENAVTSKKLADMKGWKTIFAEFGPKVIKPKTKKYKFEEI